MSIEGLAVWLFIFIVLALLATIPVHFHLKSLGESGGGARPGPAAKPERRAGTRPCPQCAHPTAVDSAFCEKCGVPMMLWQLKLSREVKEAPGEERKKAAHLVPIIDQDVCIGCSACVNACATNVLQIVAGKSAVTNLAACTGAAACAEVCPTGACQLIDGGGGAARRVEVPRIGPDFETNVKGIYAVGELGGLGLIKNAVNEGQLVIEGLKGKHQRREGVRDFVIVGGGPAGLSAGLAAKEAGYDAVLLEQGGFADTIRRFPNKKVVMAEPVRVPMYGSLWISDAPKETLLSVWQTIIESAGIDIHENEEVTNILRGEGDLLKVETSKSTYEAQRVILAIGKRGTPRRLEVEGAELAKVMYSLTDAAQYQRSRVLVVGGGDSAAEAALGLSAQPGNEVTLSYRKKAFERLKEKNQKSLEEAIGSGRIRFLPASSLSAVRPREAVLHDENGAPVTIPNDFVFALIGGTSPNALLKKFGVEIVTKELMMNAAERIPA
jgi:thioredoxin reductase/NAD-dependent dihydropyrimidine dehydrogenase PreA subunit